MFRLRRTTCTPGCSLERALPFLRHNRRLAHHDAMLDRLMREVIEAALGQAPVAVRHDGNVDLRRHRACSRHQATVRTAASSSEIDGDHPTSSRSRVTSAVSRAGSFARGRAPNLTSSGRSAARAIASIRSRTRIETPEAKLTGPVTSHCRRATNAAASSGAYRKSRTCAPSEQRASLASDQGTGNGAREPRRILVRPEHEEHAAVCQTRQARSPGGRRPAATLWRACSRSSVQGCRPCRREVLHADGIRSAPTRTPHNFPRSQSGGRRPRRKNGSTAGWPPPNQGWRGRAPEQPPVRRTTRGAAGGLRPTARLTSDAVPSAEQVGHVPMDFARSVDRRAARAHSMHLQAGIEPVARACRGR